MGQETIIQYEKFIEDLKKMKFKLQPTTIIIINFVNNLRSKLLENMEKINETSTDDDLKKFH